MAFRIRPMAALAHGLAALLMVHVSRAEGPPSSTGGLAPSAPAPSASAPSASSSAVPAPEVSASEVEVDAAGERAQPLSFAQAIELARTRGFDVLAAEANVRGAEADVRAAGPLPNPTVSAYVGRTFNYSPDVPGCEGCSRNYYFADLSDQGLVEGLISRKRALRESVAHHGLEAARYGRADTERWLVAETKIQYVQAAAARARWTFAREVARSLEESVKVNRVRYPGIIDEGQLARVEQEALRAEQEVDRARRLYRQEQIDLALLLGVRGPLPELAIDEDVLRFRVPAALASPDRAALLREALDHRPDRKRAEALEAQGDAAVTLAERRRVPDMSVHVQYQQAGTGQSAVQPPTLAVGLELPLPIFYQQQGEVGRAEADRRSASIARQRVESTIAAELESAYNAFVTARTIVSRYETALLERARRALDVTRVQFNAGSATLMDLLDAQRTWVTVNRDYNTELVNYWTAVFSLELAVGKELAR